MRNGLLVASAIVGVCMVGGCEGTIDAPAVGGGPRGGQSLCQSAPRTPTTLAAGLKAPIALRAEGARLVWVDDGLMSIEKAGGEATRLATGTPTGAALASDENYWFWASGHVLVRTAKDGSGSTEIGKAPAMIVDVFVEQGRVYAATELGLRWFALDGADGGVVHERTLSGDWALFAARVDDAQYYLYNGGARRLETLDRATGAMSVVIADQAIGTFLPIHGTLLVGVVDVVSASMGRIYRFQANERTEPMLLAEGQQSPIALAQAEDGTVYWINAGTNEGKFTDGAIMRRKVDSAGPEIVLDNLSRAHDLVVDECALYWLESDRVVVLGR